MAPDCAMQRMPSVQRHGRDRGWIFMSLWERGPQSSLRFQQLATPADDRLIHTLRYHPQGSSNRGRFKRGDASHLILLWAASRTDGSNGVTR
jgi:hypothetical protein